jgi:hypothetical protein
MARKAAKLRKELVLYSARQSFATDLLDGAGNLKLVMNVRGMKVSRLPRSTCISSERHRRDFESAEFGKGSECSRSRMKRTGVIVDDTAD